MLFYFTFSKESRAQMSAIAHDSIGAENRGSTDAVPRQVNDINFVFILFVVSSTLKIVHLFVVVVAALQL